MELIEASGTHLLGLVTDLIDVSRVESGQMRIQKIPFDLSAEIERVADIYALRAAEKGLTFTSTASYSCAPGSVATRHAYARCFTTCSATRSSSPNKGWVNLTARYGEQIRASFISRSGTPASGSARKTRSSFSPRSSRCAEIRGPSRRHRPRPDDRARDRSTAWWRHHAEEQTRLRLGLRVSGPGSSLDRAGGPRPARRA